MVQKSPPDVNTPDLVRILDTKYFVLSIPDFWVGRFARPRGPWELLFRVCQFSGENWGENSEIPSRASKRTLYEHVNSFFKNLDRTQSDGKILTQLSQCAVSFYYTPKTLKQSVSI